LTVSAQEWAAKRKDKAHPQQLMIRITKHARLVYYAHFSALLNSLQIYLSMLIKIRA